MWVWLYVIQFLLMPVIARDYWLSLFVGNSLYLVAFGYYFTITFLGYNGKCGFSFSSPFNSPPGALFFFPPSLPFPDSNFGDICFLFAREKQDF